MATIPRGYRARWAEVPGSAGTWNKPSKAQYIREYYWAGGRGGGGAGSYTAPEIKFPGFGGNGGGGGNGTGSSNYALPEYNLPERSDARISELRTKSLNPMLRGIRNNLRASMVRGRISDNPYAESLRRGQLLAGTGSAIGSAGSAANKIALQQYAPEFAAANQKAAAEYAAGVRKAGAEYAGGLQRGNLQYQTQARAAIARAQMEHQAKMAQLQAELKSQYYGG